MAAHGKFKFILLVATLGAALACVLLPPVLSRSGVPLPLCGQAVAAAQENTCLDRDVTISAQQVQILQLQGTINAQQIANLNLAATLAALEQRTLPPVVITVPVIVTATRNSNATEAPPVVTATPERVEATPTDLPANCIRHTIAAGETPFGIANEYVVDSSQLLAVNGLDEQSVARLQVGQVLIVPLPGCALTAAVPVPVPATITLPPTASNAQVEIVRVLSPGDLDGEAVDIRNNGPIVDLSGWTLSNGRGAVYHFAQVRLFTGGVLTLYTRPGSDTPAARFWGLTSPLWAAGETLTLANDRGEIQAVYPVP